MDPRGYAYPCEVYVPQTGRFGVADLADNVGVHVVFDNDGLEPQHAYCPASALVVVVEKSESRAVLVDGRVVLHGLLTLGGNDASDGG